MDDPKVRVRIGDGLEYLQKCALRAEGVKSGEVKEDWWDSDIPSDGQFDVIITDNSQMDEPELGNGKLFSEDYYKGIHQALRQPDGILSSLGTMHFLMIFN